MSSAERRIRRLETPRNKRGESAGFFLQVVQLLEVVDAVGVIFAYAEHHGRRGAHSQLVRRAVHIQPVAGQAFQARDLVAHFVIQDFRASPGNRIEARIPEPGNRVANGQPAIFRDGNDLRRRIAVQMDLGKALLDASHHLLVPLDLQVGMQATLHEHPGPAQFHGLLDLGVDRVEIEDVPFFGPRSLQRPVEGTERAVFGTKIGVIDVAINDVGDHAFRMQLAAHRVRFDTNADQVVGAE